MYIYIHLHISGYIYIYLYITVHHIPVFRSTPVCVYLAIVTPLVYGAYGQGT